MAAKTYNSKDCLQGQRISRLYFRLSGKSSNTSGCESRSSALVPLASFLSLSFMWQHYCRTILICCRDMLVKFKNTELCRLTEQVIFTDPYYSAPMNRHTSPHLDAWAANIRSDAEAKAAAIQLKVGSAISVTMSCHVYVCSFNVLLLPTYSGLLTHWS